MKKKNDIKKEVKKIKKLEDSKVNKRRKPSEPDLWKEIRTNLKPLVKAYNKFSEKRRIAKQKEESRRLKEKEKQILKEEETLKLQAQEERRFKREKKLKEEEERRVREQEKQILEEKRIKDERHERIRQEQNYRERLLKGEEERIKQLKKVNDFREEGKKIAEERFLKMNSTFFEKDKIKNEEQRLKEKEQRLKEKEQSLKEKEQSLKEGKRSDTDDDQKKKRLNGTVLWFNDAKGYGFIKREDEEKNVFVHFTAVQNSGLKNLKESERLTFEVEYSDKGPSAVNLQRAVDVISNFHLKVIK